ncbi:thiamine pyrophosphate-binding protein [Calidifontibacillus erzurumensis]|nr:thiamine pyrophosphate-binding protein [Calidifontibacillus erzurumensis]
MATVLEMLMKQLKTWNVMHIFGIPGRPVGPLIKEMTRQGIKFVLNQHETGAGYAAGGYALERKTLGVAFATAGPGGTNMITAAGQAMAHQAPVLFITGQMSAGKIGKSYSQDSSIFGADLVKMFEPVTKYSARVERGDSFESHLRYAVERAFTGVKGPVHLSLPLDVLFEEITPFNIDFPKVQHTIAANLEEVLHLIHEAQRPVFLLGKGVRTSNSYKEIFEVATRWNIPVITTGGGKGTFPTTHPLSLGVYGLGGSIEADRYLESGVDVMIVAGSSLHDMALAGFKEKFYPEKVIHFDYDPTFVGKSIPRPTLYVPGDLKSNFHKILQMAEEAGLQKKNENALFEVAAAVDVEIKENDPFERVVSTIEGSFDPTLLGTIATAHENEYRTVKVENDDNALTDHIAIAPDRGNTTATFINENNENARLMQNANRSVLSEVVATVEKVASQKIENSMLHEQGQVHSESFEKAFTENTNEQIEQHKPETYISSAKAIEVIRKLLPKNTKVFADVGSHAYFAVKHFDVYEPDTFYFDDRFISMGNGIGYAIGAKIGANDETQPVACITGDGCMLMYGTEILTAVEHRAPILFYVFNNSGLHMVETGMKYWLNCPDYTMYKSAVDFISFGKSMGCPGFRCLNEKDIEKATQYGLQSELPTIIEIMVDPDEIPPTLKREE